MSRLSGASLPIRVVPIVPEILFEDGGGGPIVLELREPRMLLSYL